MKRVISKLILISCLTPTTFSVVSCSQQNEKKEEVDPNDIKFDGVDEEKTKVITDAGTTSYEFYFSLSRNIADGEQIDVEVLNITQKPGMTGQTQIDVATPFFPQENKVILSVTPYPECEISKGDYITFDLKFTSTKNDKIIFDTTIKDFRFLYDINDGKNILPLEYLIIEDGVLKEIDKSFEQKLPHVDTLFIPNDVVEIQMYACRQLPQQIKTIIIDEGDKPLYLENFCFYESNSVETIKLPNRLVYVEDSFKEMHNMKTLDLTSWDSERTSPFASNSSFSDWPLKGNILYQDGEAKTDVYFSLREAGLPSGWLDVFDPPEPVPDESGFYLANVPATNDIYITGIDSIEKVLKGGDKMVIPKKITKIAPGAFKGIFTEDANYDGPNVNVICEEDSALKKVYGASFSNNTKLATVDFSQCKNLHVIDSSTFENSTTLNKVTLPESLLEIGANAFANCVDLECVNLVDTSVTKLNTAAFSGCLKLLWSVSDGHYLEDFKIPVSTTWIGTKCFYKTMIWKVEFGPQIDYIGYMAFSQTNVKTLNFEYPFGSPTYIGEQAFFACKRLETLKLSKDISYIGDGAFGECTDLEEIKMDGINEKYLVAQNTIFKKNEQEKYELIATSKNTIFDFSDTTIIPNIVSINAYALAGTTLKQENLINNTFDLSSMVSLDKIGDYAFTKLKFENNTDGFNVKFPDSLSFIGNYAFEYSEFKNMKGLKPFDGKTTIGDHVFAGCSKISAFVFPDEATSIPDYCFSKCNNLKFINIPSSITYFGGCCFSDCVSITAINAESIIGDVPIWNDSPFAFMSNTNKITLYVSDEDHNIQWIEAFEKLGVPEQRLHIVKRT